jgi:hypothetical protein
MAYLVRDLLSADLPNHSDREGRMPRQIDILSRATPRRERTPVVIPLCNRNRVPRAHFRSTCRGGTFRTS